MCKIFARQCITCIDAIPLFSSFYIILRGSVSVYIKDGGDDHFQFEHRETDRTKLGTAITTLGKYCHCTMLHYTTLHSLHYTTLQCTSLRNTILYYTTLHYTALHNTTCTLHYTTLHSLYSPHYTTPHYTTSHSQWAHGIV